MGKAKQYRIETLADFLKVPEGRLDDCLTDFRDWLKLSRGGKAFAGIVAASLGMPEGSLEASTQGFTWVDDDKRGLSSVRITGANNKTLARIPIDTDKGDA